MVGYLWCKFGTFRPIRDFLANFLVKLQVLSAADRWGIMDDAFSLAGAGSLAYDTAFDLAGYLEDERHPVPWISAADKFTEIYSLVYPTHLYPGFRVFIAPCPIWCINSVIYFYCFKLEIHHLVGGEAVHQARLGRPRIVFGQVCCLIVFVG